MYQQRGLLADRGHDLAIAVAEAVDGHTGGEVDVALAFVVVERRAFSFDEGQVAGENRK